MLALQEKVLYNVIKVYIMDTCLLFGNHATQLGGVYSAKAVGFPWLD